MDPIRWETRRANGDELDRVGAVLARAFQNDPMWRWALGRDAVDDRRARLRRFFDAIARIMHARHELTFTAGDFAGAAVWMPPDQWRFSLVDEARMAPAVLASFGAAGTVRLLKLLVGVERAHLREPHYYLFAIGADPEHQGRGVGSALLAPMLARCDDEKLPAYLESSNPQNIPFYRRHGFVPTGELRFGDGAVVTPMRRDPRQA
ncbi:MAG TPA: GNAT family N-acetyltransferase [Polyangia bacterium]|jgi:GNAT superfamily N-acetyltransferase|nr:GNAT family N-acetyltransferase [Polyangia bacterium]